MSTFRRAVQARHAIKGLFIEVYQNCNIFNDGAFDYFAERSVRSDNMIYLGMVSDDLR